MASAPSPTACMRHLDCTALKARLRKKRSFGSSSTTRMVARSSISGNFASRWRILMSSHEVVNRAVLLRSLMLDDELRDSFNHRDMATVEKLAAEIIAQSNRGHPADAVLRERLKAAKLPRVESRAVAELVFT